MAVADERPVGANRLAGRYLSGWLLLLLTSGRLTSTGLTSFDCH
jgi:hypothetical protein